MRGLVGWLALLLLSCGGPPASRPRVIVLALDGCDPQVLRRLLDQGKLPHFARLRSLGGFWELGTTTPPQSPVAWATFLTGQDPGGHGLFDFLQRDPQRLQPVTSMSRVAEGEYRRQLGAPPFWTYLNQRQVPATLLRVPCWFPAAPDQARTLTGLGTPDLLGSYGTFSYYSEEEPEHPLSGGTWVRVEPRGGEVQASLIGPEQQACPLHLRLDTRNGQALIEVGEPESQPFLLKQGEWSGWIPVAFPKTRGMVRFLLRSVKPLALYVSPLNDDPTRPQLPLSNPPTLAARLARQCGRYHTQGMAEESKALSAQVISDPDYLAQSSEVLAENRRLLTQGLRDFTQGFFFFYVSHLDLQSHLFWRKPEEVERAYGRADEMLAGVLSQLDAETTLWVVSDHGFAPFERVFDLNAWLAEQGWLRSQPDQPLEQIDWAGTRAYAVGFNGLYLNLRGREARGTQDPAQSDRLKRELTAKLLALRDPANGRRVVRQVYDSRLIYTSAYREQAPDLVIGYERGYRVAWETALGQRSGLVFRDNLDHWNGDHLIDPQLVPGVLLCSRPIRRENPSLKDLAPTILKQFQVAPPPAMTGRNLLED
ncbi:MAG: alkaline phosphatase family protein [Candidatus Eremiobacteraeota bacterium]|nr:alkaline phosphatase family protein [Candidatus Eremiobacteraeota bacterium]